MRHAGEPPASRRARSPLQRMSPPLRVVRPFGRKIGDLILLTFSGLPEGERLTLTGVLHESQAHAGRTSVHCAPLYAPWGAILKSSPGFPRARSRSPISRTWILGRKPGYYDAIVIAVGHRQFADMGSTKIHTLGKPKHVLYDVKHRLPAQDSDARV